MRLVLDDDAVRVKKGSLREIERDAVLSFVFDVFIFVPLESGARAHFNLPPIWIKSNINKWL